MRPPAALILELAHGAMSTHILGALARLDIAEHLAAGPRGVADLAAVTGTEPELLDRLLRAATVLGLVERTAAGLITTTEAGACLRAGPGSLRDFALMLSAPGQLRPLELLTEALRGKPVAEAALGQPIWDYYRDHPDEGAAFAGAMSGVAATIAGAGRGAGGRPAVPPHRGRGRRPRHAAAGPARHRAAGAGRGARPARGGPHRTRGRAHRVRRR